MLFNVYSSVWEISKHPTIFFAQKMRIISPVKQTLNSKLWDNKNGFFILYEVNNTVRTSRVKVSKKEKANWANGRNLSFTFLLYDPSPSKWRNYDVHQIKMLLFSISSLREFHLGPQRHCNKIFFFCWTVFRGLQNDLDKNQRLERFKFPSPGILV